MVILTQSLLAFLTKKHKNLIVPLSFGHLECFTEEIQSEYKKWCKSEEGKRYLIGGDLYDPEYQKKIRNHASASGADENKRE